MSTAFTRYGVHNIDSLYTEYTAFRWSALYILMRDGFRCIYSWEMEYARIPRERWSPQHLLIKVGANNIFTIEVGNIAFIQES